MFVRVRVLPKKNDILSGNACRCRGGVDEGSGDHCRSNLMCRSGTQGTGASCFPEKRSGMPAPVALGNEALSTKAKSTDAGREFLKNKQMARTLGAYQGL